MTREATGKMRRSLNRRGIRPGQRFRNTRGQIFTVIGRSGGYGGEYVLCWTDDNGILKLILIQPCCLSNDPTTKTTSDFVRIETTDLTIPSFPDEHEFLPHGLYVHENQEECIEILGLAELPTESKLFVVGFFLYRGQRLYLSHFHYPQEWGKSGWLYKEGQ